MKRILFLFLFLISVHHQSSAQNYKAQFNELIKGNKDSTALKKVLHDWKASKPDDAELYVAFYNYYVLESRVDLIALERTPKGEESLKMIGTDSTNKGEVAYINDGTYYKPEYLNVGFAYIDTGIRKFPSRLDMWFGKVYMFGEIKDYKSFTNELIKVVEYSAKIDNRWTWTDNEPLKDPKNYLLGSLQDYIVQLYNEGDVQANNINKLAGICCKYYPKRVEFLSDYSISFIMRGDFKGALKPLLDAAAIAPEDAIVLNNIAFCYYKNGDKTNAIKYYELAVKFGDDRQKEQANEKLSELRKK